LWWYREQGFCLRLSQFSSCWYETSEDQEILLRRDVATFAWEQLNVTGPFLTKQTIMAEWYLYQSLGCTGITTANLGGPTAVAAGQDEIIKTQAAQILAAATKHSYLPQP
jgi:hypothetical protein